MSLGNPPRWTSNLLENVIRRLKAAQAPEEEERAEAPSSEHEAGQQEHEIVLPPTLAGSSSLHPHAPDNVVDPQLQSAVPR